MTANTISIDEIDRDGNGSVDLEEFKRALLSSDQFKQFLVRIDGRSFKRIIQIIIEDFSSI